MNQKDRRTTDIV